MLVALASLHVLLLGVVSVSADSVPAHGRQEAIVTLDRAAMVRITANSPQGTACEIVDHLRGPFSSSGHAGKTNCDLELLLDAGRYKLRLDSPRTGKGKVSLHAVEFVEVNPNPVRLEPGRTAEGALRPHQQASFWIHLDKRRAVTLRVAGRSAGGVAIWRNGEWTEDVGAHDAGTTPRPGQPIHEWWIDRVMEPGEYLLTVYGTDPRSWTQGEERDFLSVSYGFTDAPPSRSATVTLPASGFFGVQLAPGPVVAFVAIRGTGLGPTDVRLSTFGGDGTANPEQASGECQIDPKALDPECAAAATGDSRHALLVHGTPGATVTMQWAPFDPGAPAADGHYTRSGTSPQFEVLSGGEYLVGLHEVPADRDSAPLGCFIQLVHDRRAEVVAYDLLPVGHDSPFRRSFNYSEGGESIYFQVTDGDTYRISTSGERKNDCSLLRLDGERAVVASSTEKTCELVRHLTAGPYELKLGGGTEGIERLTIARFGTTVHADTPTKSACLFRSVSLGRGNQYQLLSNRVGRAAARGLILRPLPLTLNEPLPVLVESGATLQLPVGSGSSVEVRGRGAEPFTCMQAATKVESRAGSCTVPGGAGTLTLTNHAGDVLAATVRRESPAAAAPPPLTAFSPKIAPIPALTIGAHVFVDFDRGQSHSFVFDVRDPGLYDVTTEGLLSTACQVRTPTVANLAESTGGGRGRNCLLANYLRPGRYLLTVRTVGPSRGRTAIVMNQRAAKERPPVAADGEAFFRVAAGDLVQERLTVKRTGHYQLSTTALGAELNCRLDDKQGWPVVAVPTPCQAVEALRPGDYLWTQMPLTLETMRHSRLTRSRPALVLRGNKSHAIELNTWYSVRLAKRGRDEFTFNLESDLDVTFTLTDGMQGRLNRFGENKTLKPIEVIAPQGQSVPASDEEESPSPDMDQSMEGEPPPDVDSSNEEGQVEREGMDEEPPPEVRPSRRPPAMRRPAPAPAGQKIHLTAGQYQLVTVHSQGDVAIAYRLHLDTEQLTSGLSKDLPVPTEVGVRVPHDGTLRLLTQGDADVRCRMFDASGKLVIESSENGDDWNCAFAEPFTAGDYRLVIESETQTGGTTRVVLAMPKEEDAGALAKTTQLHVAASPIVATLPAAADNVVQEVDLSAKTPFSCAVLDPKGALLRREASVLDCRFLIRPSPGSYRLRVWTLDRPSEVMASVQWQPISASSSNRWAGSGTKLTMLHPGRFKTTKEAFCLPDAQRGVLQPCGPAVSLETGAVVFAMPGLNPGNEAELKEEIASLGEPAETREALTARPFIQRQTSRGESIHLVQVTVAHGERTAPSCEIAGGAREVRDEACFAVSGPTTDSIVRRSAASEQPIDAVISAVAAPYPRSASAMSAGHQTLAWTGSLARFALPSKPVRVQLTLPPHAWAIQLDSHRIARDVCAPGDELSRCGLAAEGGEVVLYSPAEPRAEADLFLLDAAPEPAELSSLYESRFASPGTRQLRILAGHEDRFVSVTGAATCIVHLDDGTRRSSCQATVPQGHSAEIRLDHGSGPVRAVLSRPEEALAAELGRVALSGSPPALDSGNSVTLTGSLVQRSFQLDRDALFRLHSDSGTCALFTRDGLIAVEGLDGGCDLNRVLPAGTHRLIVRAFDGIPLSGAFAWTSVPVENLADGVGPERWVAPGESRFFRFATASAGQVGLGLQVKAEDLECTVFDNRQRSLGDGCQQFLSLDAGTYLLAVRAPAAGKPMRFRPVVVGLAGSKMGVPPEYLTDFFERIRGNP
jgi:hypothetical protein